MFKETFAQVTEARCHGLFKNNKDKKWAILWSGGIDSTVIVSSIIKNLDAKDRENILILLNNASVYENPNFFYKFIKPNFKIKNSNNQNVIELIDNGYVIINGHPADQMMSSRINRLFWRSGFLEKDYEKEPDELIKTIAQEANNRKFAEWLYESTAENLKTTDLPIKNYYQWGWWQSFNWLYTGCILQEYFGEYSRYMSFKSFLSNIIPWYHTTEYQQWAMNNIGAIPTVDGVKLVNKQYIYDLDKNEYYFNFKIKTSSSSRETSYHNINQNKLNPVPACILDDLSTLDLKNNLKEYLELLPAFVRKI
jgi:hypothetical protein